MSVESRDAGKQEHEGDSSPLPFHRVVTGAEVPYS